MIGLNLRHFARVGGEAEAKTGAPREAHENSRGLGEAELRERDSGALDYRFTPGEQSPEVRQGENIQVLITSVSSSDHSYIQFNLTL